MESIILVYGGNKKVSKNYSPRSLAGFDLSSESPFWLDLLSPSEHFLHRISIQFRFHPRAIKACLSAHQSPSCKDCGDYLFVKAFLLESSKRNLFIQRDMNIFLSSEYLITIHKDRTLLHHLLPGLHKAGFNRSTTLLLTFFDWSNDTLVKTFSYEDDDKNLLINKDGKPNKNPLWRRIRSAVGDQEFVLRFAEESGPTADSSGDPGQPDSSP